MESFISVEHRGVHATDARWQVADFTIGSITTLRIGTNEKYGHLSKAGIAQLVAIIFLGTSAVAVFV